MPLAEAQPNEVTLDICCGVKFAVKKTIQLVATQTQTYLIIKYIQDLLVKLSGDKHPGPCSLIMFTKKN